MKVRFEPDNVLLSVSGVSGFQLYMCSGHTETDPRRACAKGCQLLQHHLYVTDCLIVLYCVPLFIGQSFYHGQLIIHHQLHCCISIVIYSPSVTSLAN